MKRSCSPERVLDYCLANKVLVSVMQSAPVNWLPAFAFAVYRCGIPVEKLARAFDPTCVFTRFINSCPFLMPVGGPICRVTILLSLSLHSTSVFCPGKTDNQKVRHIREGLCILCSTWTLLDSKVLLIGVEGRTYYLGDATSIAL